MPGGESRRKVEQKADRLRRLSPETPAVRVKRWGKSPPATAATRRLAKPRPVQGEQGPPRGCPPRARVAAKRDGHPRQNPAYRPAKGKALETGLFLLGRDPRGLVTAIGEAAVGGLPEPLGAGARPSPEAVPASLRSASGTYHRTLPPATPQCCGQRLKPVAARSCRWCLTRPRPSPRAPGRPSSCRRGVTVMPARKAVTPAGLFPR